MGVSSDGILVFGVDLGEELPEFLEDFGADFDEYIHEQLGLSQYGEPGHDFSVNHKARGGYIADLARYCSYEFPMYIMALRGTETSVSRGDAKEIDPKTFFEIDENRLEEFKTWLKERGIEDEPKWYLTSMYG